MATPTPDNQLEELVDDIEAYLHRCSALTDFAEGQVQERVRLARMIDQLLADRQAHLRTIDDLDRRLRSIEGSFTVRAALLPQRLWRKARRSGS